MASFFLGFITGPGSAFLQFVVSRFASFGPLAWREISVIWGVEDELRKLQRTFLKVRDLVDCVDGSPLRFLVGSDAWQIWFEDMRKLAYDADALLDQVSLNLSSYCAKHSVITSNQEKQILPMVIKSREKLILPHKISETQKKLEELAKEMESLVMIEKAKSHATLGRSSQPSSFYSTGSSLVDDKSMVGRVHDKERIVDLLLSKEFERSNFEVIPIVGMGGIGKTALAQLVYNDDNVWKSSEKRIWVSISMDFDAVRVTKSMIQYATRGACDVSDFNTLQVMLQDTLRGRKFLLVLDDYWSEKYDDWDTLCSPFRFGAEGSKVIVTTRSTKVASIVSSSEAYKLEFLSNDDCWELIVRRAFMSMETSQNLEPIGKQIAEKCKGLPLVAMTLGSMLRCKSTEEEWRGILENELWDMPC